MPSTSTAILHPSIDACIACYRSCTETVRHCLERGGDHVALAPMTLLLDCAEHCRTSADLMLRGSPQHHLTCGVCAELCDLCAVHCDRLGHTVCAQACRTCAQTCHAMAAEHTSVGHGV